MQTMPKLCSASVDIHERRRSSRTPDREPGWYGRDHDGSAAAGRAFNVHSRSGCEEVAAGHARLRRTGTRSSRERCPGPADAPKASRTAHHHMPMRRSAVRSCARRTIAGATCPPAQCAPAGHARSESRHRPPPRMPTSKTGAMSVRHPSTGVPIAGEP